MVAFIKKRWVKKLAIAGHDIFMVTAGIVIVGGAVLIAVFALLKIGRGALAPAVVSPGIVDQKAVAAKTASTPPAMGVATGNTLLLLNQTQLDAELQDIASMGFTWVRMDLDWSIIQSQSATRYDWAGYDRIVNSAVAHHLQILAVLAYTPTWARPSQCTDSPKCAPANVTDYANFARAAANHYAPKVTYWEIWNEPNITDFWQPAPNVVAYTNLLKAGYNALKGAQPGMHVISAGLSPAEDQAPAVAPRTFLSGMYANGAKNYFDALGDHPYSYPAPPNVVYSWSAWSQMADTTPSLRSIMQANGDAGKNIWITEYGAPTGGPDGQATADTFRTNLDANHVDEQFQTTFAQQAVAAYKTYSWVGPMFWYSYKDLGTSQDTNENFFGMLRADGTQKPLYATFKQLLGH